ncbi:MDR family MFS transporter [Marinobacter sp. F3R11]|uniref:MDR family MFS transporter n=1 Tax=Marinobacter sp. F3R11 TaxID=2267231 RepID=UPI001C9E18C6|nr:MDR family MFS transporter [Marinobacter sp. F3R11]
MSETEALFERYGPRYKWFITLTVMLGTLSMTMAATIVNVAIPDIMGNFGIAQTKAQWLSTGFLAAMAAFMLLSSWVLQTFGMKGAYIGAMVLFMIAAVLGGVSLHEDMVILSRILQGAMAGIIQPLAMTVIFRVFPPEQRGLGMGVYGLGVVLGPAVGPALGGFMVDWLSWRAVFFLPLPACLAGIMFALFFAPARGSEDRMQPFDWTGFTLLCAALGLLLWTLSNGQRLGWGATEILSCGIGALVTSVVFVVWEWHSPRALLAVRIFANPGFAASCLVAFCYGAGLFGSTYLVPLFVQEIQGFSASASGLLLIPAGLAMGLMFPVAGRLSDLYPAPLLIALGATLFAWSCWSLAVIDVYTLPWVIVGWVALGRIGLGLGMPALSTGSLNLLPPHLLSQGAGANNFSRQLGGAMGVNVLAVVLEWRSVGHAAVIAETQTMGNEMTREWLSVMHDSYTAAGASADQIHSLALRQLGEVVWFQGYSQGFQDSFLILALAFAFALIPAWLMRRAGA